MTLDFLEETISYGASQADDTQFRKSTPFVCCVRAIAPRNICQRQLFIVIFVKRINSFIHSFNF